MQKRVAFCRELYYYKYNKRKYIINQIKSYSVCKKKKQKGSDDDETLFRTRRLTAGRIFCFRNKITLIRNSKVIT